MDTYHHGDLRQALIDATESLLAERGPEAFSLREVARRAGVSPAAPAHHFGDASGLLTAVVALAFAGLTQALREGDARGGSDPRARLREQGVGYVEFALRHPGRFRLMFRDGLLREGPDLVHNATAAFEVLEGGVRAALGVPAGQALAPDDWSALLALWSVVHGFAHLAIAGRFDWIAGRADRQQFVEGTVRPMLERVLDGTVPAPRRRSTHTKAAHTTPRRPGNARRA